MTFLNFVCDLFSFVVTKHKIVTFGLGSGNTCDPSVMVTGSLYRADTHSPVSTLSLPFWPDKQGLDIVEPGEYFLCTILVFLLLVTPGLEVFNGP